MTHDSKELAPKPAPDAMREGLQQLIDRFSELAKRDLPRGGVRLTKSERRTADARFVVDECSLLLAAPVPPPDGAAEDHPNAAAGHAGLRAATNMARRAPAPPPSDDVRSALAAAMEQFRHIALGTDSRAGNGDHWAHAEAGKGFKAAEAALRSAPVSSPAIEEKVFTDICDELGCVYDNEAALIAIANLKQPVPAVGVTRDAIARIIRGARINDDQISAAESLCLADAILALRFPAPDATVSEPKVTDDQFEDMVLAAMHATMNSAAIKALTVTKWKDGIDIERVTYSAILFAKEILRSSPQHVGREAAVSARDAVIEALAPFANLANGYDDEMDSDDRPVGPVQLKFCRAARAAIRSLTGAKP